MYDGKVIIGTELDTKTVDAQINKLEKDLNVMVKALETDMQIPVELRMSESEKINLLNDIEKTKNKIISLKENMQDTGDTGDKMNNKISKGLQKGIKNLKRFGLALFSVRSIFSVVSKASSSYLSQNEELANRLQSVWVGLGSFLTPVLETISNVLLKGLGYLNVFVKALTGVDYIAKANANAINKQAEAQKNLNKATQDYDFDVIRKQQELTQSQTGSLTSYGGIEIPELDDKIVKKLQDLAKWLQENENLVKAVGIALGVTFGAVAIAKLLTNIGNLIGLASAGTGLAGLGSILKFLGTVGIVSIGVSLLYTALTGHNLISDLQEIRQGIKDIDEANQEMAKNSTEATEKFKNNLENIDEKVANLSNETIQKFIDQTNIAVDSTNDLSDGLFEQNKNLASTNEQYKSNTTVMENNLDTLGVFKEELETIKKRLEKENKELDKNSDKYKENDDLLNQINETLSKIDGYEATATANLKIQDNSEDWVTNLSKKLNNFLTNFNEKITGIFNPSSKKEKGYALGGIVTQPTRALIGEAGYPEAVVPMNQDYLSTLASEIGKYSGGGSGGTVNVYLDGRLIQRQVQQVKNNKDFATNS